MDSNSREDSTSFSTAKECFESEHPSITAETNISDAEVDLVVKSQHKVLHFCDGTLEECVPDEDEPDTKSNLEVDPKTLPWGPWIMHLTTTAGTKTLQAVDYVGETLANFFGITTPKYQYEIDEYEIMQAEEEEEKKHHDLEMGGWTKTAAEDESNLPENKSHSQGESKEICDDTIKSQPHSLQS